MCVFPYALWFPWFLCRVTEKDLIMRNWFIMKSAVSENIKKKLPKSTLAYHITSIYLPIGAKKRQKNLLGHIFYFKQLK